MICATVILCHSASPNCPICAQSASCMAMSGDGQHALLASRRLLVLVDLRRPEHHLRALSWQSKYDAGSAAWSRAKPNDLAVTVRPECLNERDCVLVGMLYVLCLFKRL